MHEIRFREDSRPDGSPAWEAEASAEAAAVTTARVAAAVSEWEGDGRYWSRLGSHELGRDNKQPLASPFME